MEKKENKISGNGEKNLKNLQGLYDKSKTLKDQKSKSLSNLSKEKTIKFKPNEDEKQEKKIVQKNNFLLNPKKNININENKKLSVIFSKKQNNNLNKIQNENSSNNYSNNENLTDDNDAFNIESTKKENSLSEPINKKNLKIQKQNFIKNLDEKIKKNNYIKEKNLNNPNENNLKKNQPINNNKSDNNDSNEDNIIQNNLPKEKILKTKKPFTINSNNQNKSKITNEKSKIDNNKMFSNEEKMENLEKINECYVKIEKKKVEKENMDIMKKKILNFQKKLRALQEKGIEINLDNLDQDENENQNDYNTSDIEKLENSENNLNKNKNNSNLDENNYVFHDSDDIETKQKEEFNREGIEKGNKSQIKNNYEKLNYDSSKLIERISKKPSVNTLEFIKKISEERKRICSKSPGKSEILNRSDSFRRSNSENNNKIYQKNLSDNDEHNINSEIQSSSSIFNKKNNSEEKKQKEMKLKEFIERKKKEKKIFALKAKDDNNKMMEYKLHQLFELEKKINSNNEKIIYKKKTNSSNSNNFSRQSNSVNKVRNDYYIGTKKNLDESSILDPDDFYYTVLESKNIIVTQSQNSNKLLSAKNSNSTYKENNFKASDEFKQNAVSRLSDFTSNKFDIIKKKESDDYMISFNQFDKKSNNKYSQENFLKFLTENEKISLRSLDSNELKTMKNLRENKSQIENENKDLSNNKISSDNINNFTNLDSKLINSKSSYFYNNLGKTENLFENNLMNNNNIIKEKNITPNNDNLKEDTEKSLNRSDIEKDSFLLQLDSMLNQFADRLKLIYLKKNFYELINNLVTRDQILYCYNSLKNLCNLTKKSTFETIKNYANNVHVENIYSVFNNLTIFAKRNAMRKIFEFYEYKNKQISNVSDEDDEDKLRLKYFVEIINQFFLYAKKEALFKICEYTKNYSLYKDSSDNSNIVTNNKNNSIVLTKNSNIDSVEESEISEEKLKEQYYNYFKSSFDLMTKFIRKDAYHKIKEFSNKQNKKLKKNYSDNDSFINNTSNNFNESMNKSNLNSYNNSERNNEKIILNKKSSENSFASVFNQNKAYSFIANSHNTSNFSLHPNSLDSPKIRRLQIKIAQKNMEREWLENIDDKNSDSNNKKSNTSDIPLIKNEDNDQSKMINYSKLSIDDIIKDKGNHKKEEHHKNSKSIGNNDESSSSLNKLQDSLNNKNNVIINKYSNVNYNDEFNFINKQDQQNNIKDSNNRYSNYNDNSIDKISIEKEKIPLKENKINSENKFINDKNIQNNIEDLNKLKTHIEKVQTKIIEKSSSDEIVEDILYENFEISNRKKSPKNSSGRILGTEGDISADKEANTDIDWIYNVSQSKSGSFRDTSANNLIKQFTETSNRNEENKNTNYFDQKNSDNILNKHLIENTKDIIKKEELEDKIKELNIERKNTEEDYSNNYDDFENIDEDIIEDGEDDKDLLKIITEESSNNNIHNNSIGNNQVKSRNVLKNLSEDNQNLIDKKQKINEIIPDKIKKDIGDLEIDKNKFINTRLIHSNSEKEIDLEHKNVNLNFIEGRETIESVKDLKSIESDDNDFFKIKSNNNHNILNLLDDKSSNNKSLNVLSHNSRDIKDISDNASSYNLKDVQLNKDTINSELNKDILSEKDRKKDNFIINKEQTNKDLLANKRYENLDSSVRKSADNQSENEINYINNIDINLLSQELADKIINDLIESEINNKYKGLIPKKTQKSDANLLNILNSLNNTNKSSLSLDTSTTSAISTNLFSKSVIDHKKETSIKLYYNEIGPKLIDNIVDDISKSKKYFKIYGIIKK